MAYVPKILYPSSVPADSGSTLYTVPPDTSAIVKNIVMTNTTSTEARIHVSIVPLANLPATANRILSDYPVPPNGVSTLDLSLVMPTGSFIHATNVSTDAVTVTISGVEIT